MWPFNRHRHRWVELMTSGDGSTIYGCNTGHCVAHKRTSDTGLTNKVMTPEEEKEYGIEARVVSKRQEIW